jgi:hypothetical protein
MKLRQVRSEETKMSAIIAIFSEIEFYVIRRFKTIIELRSL